MQLAKRGSLRGLTEADSKARLAVHGFPLPQSRPTDAAGMAGAAHDLRFPLVPKMIGTRLAHKSEAGAVALGLPDPEALLAAAKQMQQRVAAHDPLAFTDQFLIEDMAEKPVAELLVSLRRDPDFGPALTISAGGVLVELLQDSANLMLPATEAEIRVALASLRIAALLVGYRGGPAADMAAMVGAILHLQRVFLSEADLAEIEVNPLFAGVRGATIVDALIHGTD